MTNATTSLASSDQPRMPSQLARISRLVRAFTRLAATWSSANGHELANAILAVAPPEAMSRGFVTLRRVPSLDAAVRDRYVPAPYDQTPLAAYAPGTLGAVYHAFFETHALDHGFVAGGLGRHGSDDFDYYVRRVAETHEFIHVLGAFDIDPIGEVSTVAFTLGNCLRHFGPMGPVASMPAMLLLVAGLSGVCRARPFQTGRALRSVVGALAQGLRAAPIWNTRFEDHWDEPLDAVRARYGYAA